MTATMQRLVDIVAEDPRWEATPIAALAERAARATLAHLGLSPVGYEISVLGCDDARIAVLNSDFRGKPTPTNVLSWPAEDLGADDEGAPPDPPSPPGTAEAPETLGDIALAYDTCLREAAEQGKSFEDHLTHLVIHSVLHLLGHDHVRDGDATRMEAAEVAILAGLGITDPYDEGPAGPANT